MNDKIKLIGCYALILLLVSLLSWSAIKNYQFSETIDDQVVEAKLQLAENATLRASITIQNAEVDRLEGEAATADRISEQAIKKSLPVIEEHERRILGIRSAPKSKSYEDIRLKMIRDATL